MFIEHYYIEKPVEFALEEGLQSPQNEITTRCSVDVECEMTRSEQLRKGCPLDTGKDRCLAKEPVRVGVNQREQIHANSPANDRRSRVGNNGMPQDL